MTAYDEHEAIDGASLRAHLIRRGAIVPHEQQAESDRGPTLRLDDRGRAAAQRHIAKGPIWIRQLPNERK